MIPGELVHAAIDRGVATITLDSPHNRNALSRQLRCELAGHLTAAIERDDVRVVLLTHTGTVFCAGADLVEARDGDLAAEESAPSLQDILVLLMSGSKPVVAQVNGSARAGGLGLIAACDIAVADVCATFALTEVRIGVVAAVISVPLLPQLTLRAAQDMLLTGRTFDANYGVQAGLLTRAVDKAEVDTEVRRYCNLLSAGAPNALSATKSLVSQRIGTEAQLRDRFAKMITLSQQHFSSAEASEGIAAFREKRSPAWVPGS